MFRLESSAYVLLSSTLLSLKAAHLGTIPLRLEVEHLGHEPADLGVLHEWAVRRHMSDWSRLEALSSSLKHPSLDPEPPRSECLVLQLVQAFVGLRHTHPGQMVLADHLLRYFRTLVPRVPLLRLAGALFVL